jgi:hypothetical protein
MSPDVDMKAVTRVDVRVRTCKLIDHRWKIQAIFYRHLSPIFVVLVSSNERAATHDPRSK